MTYAYVFPGQGSQYVGMGEDLFDRFSTLVDGADACLGYSIKELCLEDPQRTLNQTQYTQPALYTVNVLSYLAKIEDGDRTPEFLAGHSLGEFSALFAAGAYDFLTGLKIVRKRGQLMSRADKGAMAAVIGIDIVQLREMLEQFNMGIEIANINSPIQTIISGSEAEISASQQLFEKADVKCVKLNVSAAFHSSLMLSAKREFGKYLGNIQLKPLNIPVISNLSARPYPTGDYKSYLADQITETVNWYEAVSWLLYNGVGEIEEVGPGTVLTKLVLAIKEKPMDINNSSHTLPPSAVNQVSRSAPSKSNKQFVFMYGGQGFHYRNMGKELYEKNSTFMKEMNRCNSVVEKMSDVSLVQELYDHHETLSEFDNIAVTHPVIFSFSYCLTKVLLENGIEPAAVLGYSLGEYVAATVAGTISLENGLMLVIRQAQLLAEQNNKGGMMVVLADSEDLTRYPDDYENCWLAGINYAENFILSGDRRALLQTRERLNFRGVTSVFLPVAHAFHSPTIDPIRESFEHCVDSVDISQPRMDIYSSSIGNSVVAVDTNYFWNAVREPIAFYSLTKILKARAEYQYIDLSATASLTAFLDRAFGRDVSHRYAVNQFGKNIQSINNLLTEIS